MSIKKTLLEDIAKELNVSKTLVSMVINGKGDAYGISKKLKKKFWQRRVKWNIHLMFLLGR